MWSFYLLCVVQSLWLDLSHSKYSDVTPVATFDGATLSAFKHPSLSSFLSDEKLKGGDASHNKNNLPGIAVEGLANEVWDNILNSDKLHDTAKPILQNLLDELQSVNLPSTSPFASVQPGASPTDPSIREEEDMEKCLDLTMDEASIELCLARPECTDFSLDNLSSEYKSPTSVGFLLEGLSLVCSTNWSLSYTPPSQDMKHPRTFEYSGTCGLTVSGFMSSVMLNVIPGTSSYNKEIQIPEAIKCENCHIDTSSLQLSVYFAGGTIGNLLDKILAPALSNFGVKYADWLLCDIFSPLASRAASKILKEMVDPRLDAMMALGVETVPVQQSGYLSWSDSLLNTLHQLFDMIGVNEASLLKCIVNDDEGVVGGVVTPLTAYTRERPESANTYIPSHPSTTKLKPPFDNSLENMEEFFENTLKDLGHVTLDMNDVEFMPKSLHIRDMSIDISQVSIHGFRTLSNLELFYPSSESNVTLNSTLAFESLTVWIDFQVTEKSTDKGVAGRSAAVRAAVQLANIDLDLGLVIGLQSSVLNQLYLDQVFHLPCVLSALDELLISSLMVGVDVADLSFHMIQSSGDGDVDLNLDDLINDLLKVVVKGYPLMTSQLVMGLFQGPVREALNHRISEAIIEFQQKNPECNCDAHVTMNSTKWIAWPNSTLIQALNRAVNDLVGPSGVNNLMDCLTNDTDSVFINVPLSSPLFYGWNITISGLNSFYDFAIMSSDDKKPYDLETDLALGGECCSSSSTWSPELPDCVALNFTIKGYEHNGNYVDVKLSVKNIKLFLDVLLEVDESSLNNMPISEFLTDGCVASTVDLFEIVNCSLHTSSVEFYFVEESQEISLTKLANKVFDILVSPSNIDTLNHHVSSKLVGASDTCSAGGVSPTTDTSNPAEHHSNQLDSMMDYFRHTWKWKVVVLIVGTLVSFTVLLRMYYRKGVELDEHVGNYQITGEIDIDDIYTHEYAHITNKDEEVAKSRGIDTDERGFMSNTWIRHHLQSIINSVYSFFYREDSKDDLVIPQIPPLDSLIGNETLQLSIRLAAVLIIIVLMYTFAVSEIPSSPAALVIMEIDLGDQVSPPITVFKFGLAETIREMWQAEVYFLAILIAFFTGGWPYIKMAAMLFAWVLPTTCISAEWRDWLLVWLDLLGKWSLVDSFVMMVMMVGFNFSFDIVPGVDIRVTVNPQWGFYSFLLATAASLAVGHFVLACHRLCVVVAEKECEENMIAERIGHSRMLLNPDAPVNKISEADEFAPDAIPIKEDILHVHSQFGGKDMVVHSPDKPVESLMDHVFSVHLVNCVENESERPSGCSDVTPVNEPHCEDQNYDDDSLSTPLIDENKPPMNSTDRVTPIVHLSDLAEWNFQPAAEDSYTLSICFTKRGKVCMIVLFGLSTLLVLGGTCIPVIEFDFIGLTGYLMDEPITSYSLVDIGLKIPEASGDPHSFGVLFIQIIYFIFGIGVPLIFFTFLSGVFLTPFSLSTFRGVVVLAEVLNAWAALDVLVVSGVASVLEIRRFAQFMLGGGCDGMNAILRQTMDEPLEGNDTCFDVIASMKTESWMAYGAAFLLLSLGILMRVLGHKAIAERSLVKKMQSNFSPVAGNPESSPQVTEEDFVSRVSKNVWLSSMRFLQLVGVVSVRRKITS